MSTTYWPTVPLQDKVELVEGPSVMLDRLREQVKPTVCSTVAVSKIVPVKPLWGVTVIVEFPFVPVCTLTLGGVGTMVKSGVVIGFTVMVIVTECVCVASVEDASVAVPLMTTVYTVVLGTEGAVKVTSLVAVPPPVITTGFVLKLTPRAGEAGVFENTRRFRSPAKP